MKKGIQRRTFYSFLISMTVIIVVFSALFIRTLDRWYRDRFAEDQRYATIKTGESIERLLADIKQNAYFLTCNDKLAEVLVNKPGYDRTTQQTMLSHILAMNTGTPGGSVMQDAYAAFLVDAQFPIADGVTPLTSPGRITTQRVYNADALRDTDWYRMTVNNQNRLYAFAGEGDKVYFTHQLSNIRIADPRYNENAGVLLYALPQSVLARLLRGSQMADGSITVLSLRGAVLSSTDSALFPPGALFAMDDAGENGLAQTEIGGARVSVSARTVSDGWQIHMFVPADTTLDAIKRLFPLYIAFFIVLVALALALSTLFARRLVKPILALSRTMRRAEKMPSLPIPTDVPSTGDEIEGLFHSYNALVAHIRSFSEQIRENSEALRATELKALQAQINPHFIYNTLDSVACIALIENNQDIASMVASLVNILKYSVDFSRMSVTLREEVEYLRQYLSIQKLRYGEDFRFTCDIPDTYNDRIVAKIILQPLVENALFHAKRRGNTLEIRLYCEEKNDRFLIHVCDNGVDADADALNRMLHGEGAEAYFGIGIRNVNKRIQIMAGADYGIRYAAGENGGLDAVISLPIEARNS